MYLAVVQSFAAMEKCLKQCIEQTYKRGIVMNVWQGTRGRTCFCNVPRKPDNATQGQRGCSWGDPPFPSTATAINLHDVRECLTKRVPNRTLK